VTVSKQKRSEDIILVSASYRVTSGPDQKSW